MLEFIKTITRQLTTKLDAIELPTLKKITIGNTTATNTGYLCEICNTFYGKNKGSLSAHQKKCRSKHAEVQESSNIFVKTK